MYTHINCRIFLKNYNHNRLTNSSCSNYLENTNRSLFKSFLNSEISNNEIPKCIKYFRCIKI